MNQNPEQENLRRDRSALRAALIDAGAVFTKENVIKCPFHDDQNPSASLYEKENVWRFKCHGCGYCGDVFDVKAKARGCKVEDVLRDCTAASGSRPPHRTTPVPPPQKQPRIYPTIEALAASVYGLECPPFVYTHPQTKAVEMIVLRMRGPDGKKSFIQAGPVDGGFVMKAPPKQWPIYNRTRVAGADSVVVVEGEKCVHALAEIGIVATTSPGGAGKAQYADWTPLAGKTVHLWADNDANGVGHMADVRVILESLNPPAKVFIVDHTMIDVGEKGDAVDFIALWKSETPEETRRPTF